MELVKINFNGTVFLDENRSGIGVVISDDKGLVLASCSKKLFQAYTAQEVETMAATTALSFAQKLGIRRAILEGNVADVMKALDENVPTLSPTGLLVEGVKKLFQNFEQLLYSHTMRAGNYVTHSLARYAIGISDFLVWMENVPPHIQSVLQLDLVCFQ